MPEAEPVPSRRVAAFVHLVEILLPVYDREGRPFAAGLYAKLREELVERFGGLTAFSRAPAEGFWEPEAGERSRDDIVIFEVMAAALDRDWWSGFREELERRFDQDEIVIRASRVERL